MRHRVQVLQDKLPDLFVRVAQHEFVPLRSDDQRSARAILPCIVRILLHQSDPRKEVDHGSDRLLDAIRPFSIVVVGSYEEMQHRVPLALCVRLQLAAGRGVAAGLAVLLLPRLLVDCYLFIGDDRPGRRRRRDEVQPHGLVELGRQHRILGKHRLPLRCVVRVLLGRLAGTRGQPQRRLDYPHRLHPAQRDQRVLAPVPVDPPLHYVLNLEGATAGHEPQRELPRHVCQARRPHDRGSDYRASG